MFIPERKRQALARGQQQMQTRQGQMYPYNPQNINFNNKVQNQGDLQNYSQFAVEYQQRGTESFNRAYPSAYSQASSTLNRNPLPNFQNFGLSPININLAGYQPDPMPSLPRQLPNSNDRDISSLNSRFSIVQNLFNEQQTNIKLQSEAADRISSKILPFTESEISKLDNLLENSITSKIPSSLQPIQERTTRNRENLSKIQTNLSTMLSNIEDTLTEKKEDLNKFKSINQTLADSSKTELRIIKDETKQLSHVISILMQEISTHEQNGAEYIEKISKNNDDFENLDHTVTNSFVSTQKSLTHSIQDYYDQISAQVRKVADSRVHSIHILHNDAETINKRSSESLRLLKQIVSAMSVSFSEELSHVFSTLSSSISDTQSSDQKMLDNLDSRLDIVIDDSGRTAAVMTSEIIATVSNVRGNFSQTRNAIETILQKEADSVKKFQELVIAKGETFKQKSKSSLQNSMAKHEVNVDNAQRTAESQISALSKTVDKELNICLEQASNIKRLEDEISAIEESIETARSQVIGALSNLSKSVESCYSSITEVKTNIGVRVAEIEHELDVLEDSGWKEELCPKEILYQNEQRISKQFDDRISLFEENIVNVLKNIAEIGGSEPKKMMDKILPASKELKELAENSFVKLNASQTIKFPLEIPSEPPKLEFADDSKNKQGEITIDREQEIIDENSYQAL
ncbi:hypothetical protein TVAG_125650 [Trichomonas vaginalis G3]|uniref:Uncharacterized protein n=1 Tax=Trichomonas vaginalis (strain ATCC PRA-98 / G3) TaxID=412133 RepID=A2ET72_TRIV3|nr:hypothetical protein TVAGG3_0189440 [Trichomonas vaginalis G3]EAY04125.1 hypothetical protein TVAG_125650 [Trichomonas vaginalis G3]KAI5549858.1 hypothetical protein TVAGG3_0189440 [Trichomonas vaginalis G3]|eukprot:XP_001316348.1 hypothetical protein [Trichomonas vaginalis G3]